MKGDRRKKPADKAVEEFVSDLSKLSAKEREEVIEKLNGKVLAKENLKLSISIEAGAGAGADTNEPEVAKPAAEVADKGGAEAAASAGEAEKKVEPDAANAAAAEEPEVQVMHDDL